MMEQCQRFDLVYPVSRRELFFVVWRANPDAKKNLQPGDNVDISIQTVNAEDLSSPPIGEWNTRALIVPPRSPSSRRDEKKTRERLKELFQFFHVSNSFSIPFSNSRFFSYLLCRQVVQGTSMDQLRDLSKPEGGLRFFLFFWRQFSTDEYLQ